MEHTDIEDDPNTKPQLTKKNFIQSNYVVLSDSMNKKYDDVFSQHSKILKLVNSTLINLTNSH